MMPSKGQILHLHLAELIALWRQPWSGMGKLGVGRRVKRSDARAQGTEMPRLCPLYPGTRYHRRPLNLIGSCRQALDHFLCQSARANFHVPAYERFLSREEIPRSGVTHVNTWNGALEQCFLPPLCLTHVTVEKLERALHIKVVACGAPR